MGVAPDAFLEVGFQESAKMYKRLEVASALLNTLDMVPMKAVVIPKRDTVDPGVLQKNGEALAHAKVGVPAPRVRSALAKALVVSAYQKLPADGYINQSMVADKMRQVVYVDGGTEGTLGRLSKAYPKLGSPGPRYPVTVGEALSGLRNSGIDMARLPAPARRPYPLLPLDAEQGVTVNPKSDNGFPVGGQWDTPLAAQKCMGLALYVEETLRKAPSVREQMLKWEAEAPHLVLVKGKAKADFYSPNKVAGALLRFYNAFPRQIMLNMQKATQVLELNSKSILDSDELHTGIGISLVRGGGADLVQALDAQLGRDGAAYVHVGDDSWVVVRTVERKLCMFALDCSNFDLTQHATVTETVHAALRDELRTVDAKAAELWHYYARERMVVVTGTLVRKLKHGGPSGMPLQSKVNDVLMDVMIQRTLAKLRGTECTELEVAAAVEVAGAGMGFEVRLEQYWQGTAETLVEALEQQPFLFIGYYFHVRGAQVRVHADIPRTFAQVPYPSQKWTTTKRELELREAMRLGSIALNLGMPSASLEEAFGVFRTGAIELVRKVLDLHGDVKDHALRWAVQESPWATVTEPSLKGLLRALERDAGLLWLHKEPELFSTSELLPLSWGDQVEEEERRETEAAGGVVDRPASVSGVRTVVPLLRPATTHPATRRNDGRPPPTAVWGPDRAPLERTTRLVALAAKKRAEKRTRGREFEDLFAYYGSEDDDSETEWE